MHCRRYEYRLIILFYNDLNILNVSLWTLDNMRRIPEAEGRFMTG